MAFPVEMRRKTRVVKTEIELTAWLEVIEQRGYSMVDQHMKTLVPHSCFKALKDEEQEKDRLIILLKEFHSEYDFLEEGCLQRTEKRERVEYIFRDADEIREKKRIRVNQTDDVDDIL
ncbi:hypothetical protein FOCG_18380 [Fusarium oxysporum f. sp. radicis-lycopersici 26381]|uniref:Uncharacterized protein n=1 Tax=Fusarium oxysporum NRRL 32931 TaxID=660029 RepID=W9HB49_FUSOX|nr:hypothetical protein FOYG_17385 [Fusarium oxysporum NRRL 32931]EXL38992.1 hypothetical protein FOCG_18380 [Fusarium oxysporum f. sp. radicis-lycopersici 26381]